ncbi:MCE family protein [Gordonia sp. NPDC058843]|uniref:MCE family protein n=1 Tax=Gordonia sp. NPDC058843 TaxID=3346648 RepID=UPI0036B3DE9E
MNRRRVGLPGIAVAVMLASTSCGWQGVDSLALPGGQGTGPGSYSVLVDMPNITNITPNSPVLVDNVEVGRISSIELDGWHARIRLSLNGDVVLPANATASIGQTSLLGSQHIELASPVGEAPEGALTDGALIPIEHASAYPTTEQTLSALSVVVNGGGLAQLGQIVTGANDALSGREGTVRSLVSQLTEVTATLNQRRGEITTALNGLDRLATVFADESETLDDAIVRIQPALRELADRRSRLSEAITALDRFGDSARQIITASAADIRANAANIHPFLKSLADSGQSLTDSLDMAFTLPFPLSRLDRIVRGDYANLFALLDFSVPRIRSDLLRGTPLGRTTSGPSGVLGQNPGRAADADDPIRGPVTGTTPTPGVTPPPPRPSGEN